MSDLFDRYASLTVGRPGQQGTLFENLRITFQVEKTSESNPNTAKISIYNLNDNSIGLIEEENQEATLEAGYNGRRALIGASLVEQKLVGIIATGDVKNVETTRNGVDKITTFEIGDAENALQNNLVNKSFPPGVNTTQIVDEVTKVLGVVKGTIKGITDQVFSNGLAISGKAKDTMDEITDKVGAEWSVQDGELQVYPKDGSTNELAVKLTPDTGLIGAPTRKVGKDKKAHVVLNCLLNPRLRPGRKIVVESYTLSGTFTVRKCSFVGDNEEGSFICKVEAS